MDLPLLRRGQILAVLTMLSCVLAGPGAAQAGHHDAGARAAHARVDLRRALRSPGAEVLRVHQLPGGHGAGPSIADSTTGHTFVDANGTVSMVDTATGIVLGSTMVGPGTGTLLLDAPRHRLAVASSGLDPLRPGGPSMSVLNTTTGRLLRTVPLRDAASPLFEDARRGHLLVVLAGIIGRDPIAVVTLDVVTGAVVRSVVVAGNGVVDGAALDERDGRFFVATRDNGPYDAPRTVTLATVDTGSGKIVNAIGLPRRTMTMAVDDVHHRVLLVGETVATAAGSMTIADATTGSSVTMRSVDLQNGIVPGIVLDKASGQAIVPGRDGMVVLSTIDGATRAVLPVTFSTVLFDDPAGRFIALHGATIDTFDLTSDRLLTTVTGTVASAQDAPPVAAATSPGLAALDADGGRLFLLRGSPSAIRGVSMLDVRTGALRALYSFPVPAFAAQVMFDAESDRLVLVTRNVEPDAASLNLLDLRTGQRIYHDAIGCSAAMEMGDGPGFLRLDPLAHRVYCVDPGPLTHDGIGLVGLPGTMSAWDVSAGRLLGSFHLQPYPQAPQTAGDYVVVPQDGTTAIIGPARRTPADSAPRATGRAIQYFPRTHHTLRGAFLAFWRRYGGLAMFGYPETEAYGEQGRVMQYTDRFALALVRGSVRTVPVNDVLVQQVQFSRSGGPSTGARLFFARTHHYLSGRFLAYWRTHHGSVLLGAPICEPFMAGNGDGSGRRYLVQWFENGRLEYHAEMAATRYAIQIGLVGAQALRQRGWLSAPR